MQWTPSIAVSYSYVPYQI